MAIVTMRKYLLCVCVLGMLHCVSAPPQPIPGKEASVGAIRVQLLSVVGPRDRVTYGNQTYTPDSADDAVWIANLQFSGSGSLSFKNFALEPAPPRPVSPTVLACCINANGTLTSNAYNPLAQLKQGMDNFKAGGAVVNLSGSSEQRSVMFPFPRASKPKVLRLTLGTEQASIPLD